MYFEKQGLKLYLLMQVKVDLFFPDLSDLVIVVFFVVVHGAFIVYNKEDIN